MQTIFLVFSLLGTILGVLGDKNDTSEDSRYLRYQDENNVTHVIDLQGKLDTAVLQKSSPQDNTYLLYTQNNLETPQILYMNNATSISTSNYNAQVPTVVIVHGWLGNRNSEINSWITQAYLEKSYVNIIVVDWSWLSRSNYVTATFGVPSVGKALGKFLTYLSGQTGARSSALHLIGFSLGAHVVGNAARSLYSKPARITALDPAGPLWSYNTNRARKTDAGYVEATHTDSHVFGTSLNVGDTDFKPNGGYKQPGCLIDLCSHNRAWKYFAATVKYNNLIGRKCEDDLLLGMNKCSADTLPMGNDDLRKNGSGLYYVKTTSIYPYSQMLVHSHFESTNEAKRRNK